MHFTQYLMPNGRPIVTEIDMDVETEKTAAALAEQGIRFSNEILFQMTIDGLVKMVWTLFYYIEGS